MWLEDTSGFLRAGPAPRTGAAAKTVRCAVEQQRLAVREYREAARLRPRDGGTRLRLRSAKELLQSLEASLRPAGPTPLRRFLAHYNLSLRYWDLGKTSQALAEAERACDELRQARLPCGCAEHNLTVMGQVRSRYSTEQRRLLEAVKRTPWSVRANYELGVLFFDKRMMKRAEEQLKLTRERARAASSQQLVCYDKLRQQQVYAESPVWFTLEGRKAQRMAGMLDDLEDDLEFVASLQDAWCVEDEMGKAEELQDTGARCRGGVRDGPRPHLLPCLHRRYSQDVDACEQWWSEISKRADLSSA